MVRPRSFTLATPALCAILAGCGQIAGSPAAVSADSASRHVTPATTTYVVFQMSGKGSGGGSWHAHGKKNDCHGDVTGWSATGTFYVNAKTGALEASVAPPIISVSYALEGTCTDGATGPTYASAAYYFKSGFVKRPDPPSHFSVLNLKGSTNDPDVSGSATLSGPACNAKLVTSTYREGDAETYVEVYNEELTPIVEQTGCT
jgi:hypothetical protein